MARAEGPLHPFKMWRLGVGLTREQVVRMLEKCGRGTSPAYLDQIERGYRRPSLALAEAMSRACYGAVEVLTFLSYAPSGGRNRKRAA